MSAVPRRRAWLVPVAVALAAWGAGTAGALRHVLLEHDFISAEIRSHGLVPELVATLLAFALPYLALGVAAAWIARGIARREAAVGAGIVVVTLGLAVVFTIVERPAAVAGHLWSRGGVLRFIQVGLGRALSPTVVVNVGMVLGLVLGALAAWGYWQRASRDRRRGALVTVAVVAGALVVLIAGPRVVPGFTHVRPAGGAPNVVLILVDSLRPDRALDPKVAPNLAALAARSVRFTDARTPCAQTYSAIASLLTGKHPVQHHVRDLYPVAAARSLGEETLPRALARAGYETLAVGGYCATPLRELDAGFAVQRTPRSEVDLIVSEVALRGHPWLPAALRFPWMRRMLPQLRTAVEGSHPQDVTREAVTAWRRTRGPFFLTVFFDNPHVPYVPVWPHVARANDYDGPNRYTVLAGSLVEQIREGESGETARSSAAERDNARELYDDAVRSVDRSIGSLLAALRRDRLDGDTIVMLLADHGENLLDADGELAHGEAIDRDRSNAIPWTIAWPGRLEPRDVAVPVLLTDVAPTILALAAVPPLAGIDGVSRTPEARGEGASPDRPALLETGMWFVARQTVDRLDPSGRGLAYPDFDRGLLDMEPSRPPHVIVAAAHRAELVRAKHRRLDWGSWSLSYRPRETGASFALYRRDLDPSLTRDLSGAEPDAYRDMVARFYREAERLGETELAPPENPALSPSPTN